MRTVVFLSPILPGKLGAFMRFVDALNASRHSDFEEQQKRLGLTRHDIWLHRTPQGDFAIIAQEGDDMREAARIIRASSEPFDVWFRQQLLEIHGADLSRPPSGSRSQLLLEYRRPDA